jgi:hypothetical protein
MAGSNKINWWTGEGLLWGNDQQVNYNAPSYVTDPNYTSATQSLMPFASSLMSGQGLPPAYSDLTQTNSPAFQQMLSRTTGNILGATQDQMASQGIGDSGVAAAAAAGAVGNATSTLNWQDFLNSQSNQLQMMGLGANTMNSVASMGLNNMNNENQFNLINAAEASGTQLQNVNLQNQSQANLGQLMGSSMGALANIYGMSMLAA